MPATILAVLVACGRGSEPCAPPPSRAASSDCPSAASIDIAAVGERVRALQQAAKAAATLPRLPLATVSAAPFFDAVTRLRGLDAEGQRSVPDDAQLSFVPARWQTYVA